MSAQTTSRHNQQSRATAIKSIFTPNQTKCRDTKNSKLPPCRQWLCGLKRTNCVYILCSGDVCVCVPRTLLEPIPSPLLWGRREALLLVLFVQTIAFSQMLWRSTVSDNRHPSTRASRKNISHTINQKSNVLSTQNCK